jgi:signal transduction histidine kinase/ligand-binding sensor domain-containing protein
MRRLATILFITFPIWALDPKVSLSQYARKTWQVEDGLPQNYVTWIGQSADGYLLVGTSGGAARFDGLRFTPLILDAASGLTREWITVVQAGKDAGTIWVATRDAGFYELGTRHWPVRLDSLVIDKRGTPIGLGPGLFRVDGKDLTTVREGLSPSDPSWSGLLELSPGLLVASRQGLYLLADSKPPSMLLPDSVLALGSASRRDGVWLGMSNGVGFYRLSQKPEMLSGIPGPVVSLLEDRDGVLWAGTWGYGLWRVVNGRVEKFTTTEGLADNFVHALFEDREGNLWVGTRAGLSRWKSTPIVPFGLAEGVNGQFFSTVSGDTQGNVWLGTWRSGLYRFRDSGLERIPLPSADLEVLVRATASAPDGTLWMSDWSRLYRRRGSGWTALNEHDVGYDPRVHALLFDRQGRLWAGAESGLYVHEETSPLKAGRPVITGHSIRSIAQDSRGRIWAGGPHGLWRDGATIDGLPHRTVTSIAEDSRGRTWVTTRANGLVLVSDQGVRVIDHRHGLPALPLFSAVDDGRGSLWVSSPAGIFEARLADLDDLLEGRRSSVTTTAWGQDDGMRTIECQNVGYPSAWKDTAGDIWFPTVRGAVRIRPDARRAAPPPEVLVEGSTTAGLAHTVQFTAARLSAPSRIEFRYRLDSQPDWTWIGSERTLRFDALSAGAHRLLICAREKGGEWGASATVELSQQPRVYETWWFRLSIAALAAGILILLYRWRMYMFRGRYAAVLVERNRIAREWHDTLLAGFSAISWQLDVTSKRLQEKPETAGQTLEVARTMLHHYRAEARRVISDLRNDTPEPESVASAIRRSLQELMADRGIEWNVSVDGPARPLPGELAQNVLRICQEAAANAVRHAEPSRLDVHLRFPQEHVELTVRDNGRGFDPRNVPPGHFGLQIMEERARRFGGNVQVRSLAQAPR